MKKMRITGILQIHPMIVSWVLHNLVKTYFQIESLGVTNREKLNSEETRGNNILKTTTKRISERIWETGLLWNDNNIVLPGSSRQMALQRLNNLEKRLDKDAKFASL